MAENANVIRGINWRETFPFTNIFRAFRIAIHPSKLILGLLALLLLYMGGRVLDGIWPTSSNAVPGMPVVATPVINPFTGQPLPGAPSMANVGTDNMNEVELFAQMFPAGVGKLSELRRARRDAIQQNYKALLLQKFGDKSVEDNADKAGDMAKAGEGLGELEKLIKNQRDKKIADIEDQYNKAKKDAKNDKESDDAVDVKRAAQQAAYARAATTYRQASLIEGQGIFDQFFAYEINQVNQVARGVCNNDWLGDGFRGDGVVPATMRFLAVGPLWLVQAHSCYFILFGIWFLIIWSIFGGAICRIAAVHIARDEKLSLRQALKFSTGKFLSFLFAPIIPLVIVVFVGFVVFVGGLIGNIPVLGPWLISILFFLPLGAGFVMTLVLMGTFGGFNLMYPTVAVEGSDSFDAISRSFSYVYARPWRMLFYTGVAIVYGALTFLFVKIFITLMLCLAHYFVGKGMFAYSDGGVPRWDMIWPAPGLHHRTYHLDFINLTWSEKFASVVVSFWVYLVISMLGAFAVSFYFSANTIIYYLMRREVDATELDDVYLEQSEEEFETQAAVTATVTATVTVTETSPPAAPAAPPAEAPPPQAPPDNQTPPTT